MPEGYLPIQQRTQERIAARTHFRVEHSSTIQYPFRQTCRRGVFRRILLGTPENNDFGSIRMVTRTKQEVADIIERFGDGTGGRRKPPAKSAEEVHHHQLDTPGRCANGTNRSWNGRSALTDKDFQT
jgi:hypothetical protein